MPPSVTRMACAGRMPVDRVHVLVYHQVVEESITCEPQSTQSSQIGRSLTSG
jgi:hypothetical protein